MKSNLTTRIKHAAWKKGKVLLSIAEVQAIATSPEVVAALGALFGTPLLGRAGKK